MTKPTSQLVAAALVFKCLKYARALEAKDGRSPAENRALLKLKASALVTADRCKLINGRN